MAQLYPTAIAVDLAAIWASLEATRARTDARGDDGTRRTLGDLIERVAVKVPDAEARIDVGVHGHPPDIVGKRSFPSSTFLEE